MNKLKIAGLVGALLVPATAFAATNAPSFCELCKLLGLCG